MYQSVLYFSQANLPIHILEAVMSEEKNGSYKGLTEEQTKNIMIVSLKLRFVSPQRSVPSLRTTQKRWVKVPQPLSIEQSMKP